VAESAEDGVVGLVEGEDDGGWGGLEFGEAEKDGCFI